MTLNQKFPAVNRSFKEGLDELLRLTNINVEWTYSKRKWITDQVRYLGALTEYVHSEVANRTKCKLEIRSYKLLMEETIVTLDQVKQLVSRMKNGRVKNQLITHLCHIMRKRFEEES